jgi:hypothetical protein
VLFVAVAGCLFLCLFSVCSLTAHTDCFRFIFRMLAGSDLLPGFIMEIAARHSWPRPESLATHLCIKGLRSPCYIYHAAHEMTLGTLALWLLVISTVAMPLDKAAQLRLRL